MLTFMPVAARMYSLTSCEEIGHTAVGVDVLEQQLAGDPLALPDDAAQPWVAHGDFVFESALASEAQLHAAVVELRVLSPQRVHACAMRARRGDAGACFLRSSLAMPCRRITHV